MTAEKIRATLHARAAEVCTHLLPAGQRNGAEYEVGSLAGEPGESLKINLAGVLGVPVASLAETHSTEHAP